jgi:DNA replication protein DnaC
MKTTDPGDATRIELLLAELRLPAVKLVWASLAAQADKEGWPAGRFLAALAEHEIAERSCRRLERHLAEARLPSGKTLDTFDFEVVPVISKAQVMALAAGDAWLSLSASLSSKTAGACCSPAPQISFSDCKSPVASSLSKPPSPNSTNSTS